MWGPRDNLDFRGVANPIHYPRVWSWDCLSVDGEPPFYVAQKFISICALFCMHGVQIPEFSEVPVSCPRNLSEPSRTRTRAHASIGLKIKIKYCGMINRHPAIPN